MCSVYVSQSVPIMLIALLYTVYFMCSDYVNDSIVSVPIM